MEKYRILFKDMEQIRKFVFLAGNSNCDLDFGEGSVLIDAKSIAGLIAYGLGRRMTLTVHGTPEEELRNYIIALCLG